MKLEDFLKSQEYGKDLKTELEKSNPGFINSIQKRIRDMNESDHGIVIAGTTYYQSVFCLKFEFLNTRT